MIKKVVLGLLVLVIFGLIVYFYPPSLEEPGFTAAVYLEGLSVPWAIDFLPDDSLIFTERAGAVKVYNGVDIVTLGQIPVSSRSEAGLLGIAVDPDFTSNKYIYLYYTHEKGNRVSRFVLDGSIGAELVLLDNIPDARFHDGGRIKFGPDGKLYITTGDATKPMSAQNMSSLAGKILRMNKDGSIPEDNPFTNSLIYSLGHRNPQGLAWDSKGKLYASEHGQTRNDEVNVISATKNYGWPLVQCTDEEVAGYKHPIMCAVNYTLAPGGMAFYQGDLYVAGLRGTQLRRLVMTPFGEIEREEELFTDLGRLRDVVEHKGSLYIATSNMDRRGIPRQGDDKIIKITRIES